MPVAAKCDVCRTYVDNWITVRNPLENAIGFYTHIYSGEVLLCYTCCASYEEAVRAWLRMMRPDLEIALDKERQQNAKWNPM